MNWETHGFRQERWKRVNREGRTDMESNKLLYAMCPQCGRRLCKGEAGSKLEIECSKCKALVRVLFEERCVIIMKSPFKDEIDKVKIRHIM